MKNAQVSLYNTTFLRGQEEKKRYKGRGKYKWVLHQYFYDLYNRKGEKLW